MDEKQKILLVDDDSLNRELLRDILGEGYTFLEAASGEEAANIILTSGEVDLVLLDMIMPGMGGVGLLELMADYRWIDEIPVVAISAAQGGELMQRAYELGVTDYIPRPFDTEVVRRRVRNTLMLYAKQRRLSELVSRQTVENERLSRMMISILGGAVEFRNSESGPHIPSVRAITEALLRCLMRRTDRYGLTQRGVTMIGTASALHDIGKITVPDAILNKPGPLTPEEFQVMQGHAAAGAAFIEQVPGWQGAPLLRAARDICRWHHERWDGGGYPDGLRGETIPISAQAVALADVYDALTSRRCYRDALDHAAAMDLIRRGACGAFSPLLLECLEELGPGLADGTVRGEQDWPERTDSHRLSAELLRGEGLPGESAARRSLTILREKANFFARQCGGIQLDYELPGNRLRLSDFRDPLHRRTIVGQETVLAALGMDRQDLARLHAALRDASAEDPERTLEVALAEPCGPSPFRLTVRTLWSGSQPSRYLGAVGHFAPLSDREDGLPGEGGGDMDPVSGTYARSYLERARVRLRGTEGVLFLDIRDFKRINDTYGHAAGDLALRTIADTVLACVRAGDVLVRYGGDEFLLLFPRIPADTLRQRMEQIRRAVRAASVPGYPELRLAVDVGLAYKAPTLEEAVRRADLEMYRNKLRAREGDEPGEKAQH